MAKTCKARITDEYKTRKADSVWPETAWSGGSIEEHMSHPECGGKLTLTVALDDDGACGDPECCGYPSYHVTGKLECSRCKNAYLDGIVNSAMSYGSEEFINRILQDWIENGEG